MIYSKELQFDSPDKTYLRDLTPHVTEFVAQTKTESGLILVSSMHTTMRIAVTEMDESKLVTDLINYSMALVPEDERSTWVNGEYKSKFKTTAEFGHYCMDNPRRSPGEVDEDYNAARHIRALVFGNNSEALMIEDRKLVLGKYQQVVAFEFDGRDGKGINPKRERFVRMAIHSDLVHKFDRQRI